MKTIKYSDKYKNKIIKILKIHRPRLANTYNLEFKNCFSAVAGYINGQLFISCGKFGVALKLPIKICENLLDNKNGKPLKYFQKGHIKKSYIVLNPKTLENKILLKSLVDKSIKNAK